jgi:hypothetical protein
MPQDTNKEDKTSRPEELQDEELEGASGGKDWLAANFQVEIGGMPESDRSTDRSGIVGGFKSVSGFDSETEVVEYQDGDDIVLRKRPG